MSADDHGWAIFYGLMLLLPLSALVGRRIRFRQGIAMALGWVAIFAVAILVLAERDRMATVIRDVRLSLDPEAGERHGRTLRIPMAEDGHFWVRGLINGHSQRFLIDSGATTIALGEGVAQAAGVAADTGFGSGFGVPIDTANGTIVAHRATIAKLDVGGIERRDVGVVIAPEFGDMNVLGMNFLSSLSRWSVEGHTLVLEP